MKLIIKSIWVAWCCNRKRECIQILYSFWILTVCIQVLLDNTTSALVSSKDLEFHYQNIIKQKKEKNQKRQMLITKMNKSILHKNNFVKDKIGDFYLKL